ncbi:MAG: molecular chaperone DnaJ [Leptospiraceae bacterium]|nr:MAG: molecular chaperone DnaJ [Leptospiraceae bacterium]
MYNQMKNKLKTSILFDELKELSENIEYKIPYQLLLKELNLTYEEYISFLYNKFGIFEPPEYFDKNNLYTLIDILKAYNQKELLNVLRKWGLYFEHYELVEWLEHYISITLNILSNHEVKLDSLEISLAGCSNPYEGFLFYCDLHIDDEYIYKKTTELFLNKKNIKPNEYNYYLLVQYIEECFERKILSHQILYQSFFDKLYDISIKNRFISEQHKTNYNYTSSNDDKYFKILGIKQLPDTKDELKKIYFRLLKKYHPDKNPEGLEATKKIIEAYTTLMKYYE